MPSRVPQGRGVLQPRSRFLRMGIPQTSLAKNGHATEDIERCATLVSKSWFPPMATSPNTEAGGNVSEGFLNAATHVSRSMFQNLKMSCDPGMIGNAISVTGKPLHPALRLISLPTASSLRRAGSGTANGGSKSQWKIPSGQFLRSRPRR